MVIGSFDGRSECNQGVCSRDDERMKDFVQTVAVFFSGLTARFVFSRHVRWSIAMNASAVLLRTLPPGKVLNF